MEFLVSGSEDRSEQEYYLDHIRDEGKEIRFEVGKERHSVQVSPAEPECSGVSHDDEMFDEGMTWCEHSSRNTMVCGTAFTSSIAIAFRFEVDLSVLCPKISATSS